MATKAALTAEVLGPQVKTDVNFSKKFSRRGRG